MFSGQRESWMSTGATVAFVTAVYVPCVQRTVPGGDSGESITTACESGVAHPPGYPVFTLLARLSMVSSPLSSPAHSVNLSCSLSGAVACGCLTLTVCRLTGPGPGAVSAGGSFAVSRLSWQWSMVAEVFTLNNFFVGLLFFLTTSFHAAENSWQRRKIALWGAFSCGSGSCNQHTSILYVSIIIPWVLYRLYSLKESSFLGLVSSGFCFIAGFIPYIYLPISSYLNTARWSWGDQTTSSGLSTHSSRTEYGTFSLAKTEASVSSSAMSGAQSDHCSADLSPLALVSAGIGIFFSSWDRTCCTVSWSVTVMSLVYSSFFAWRANLDVSRPLSLGVVERFWLQSDAALCVSAGLGLSHAHTKLERWLGHRGSWKTAAWVFTLVSSGQMGRTNHRECDQSRSDVVERFGRELSSSFPKDSLISTRGDSPGNSSRYSHYCQDVRPDIRSVDQEMMTYSWYVSKSGKHLPGVHFPGRRWDPVLSKEKDTFSSEHFSSHNTQRDVFACIGSTDGDPSWERSFSRWPFGVCDHSVPAQRQFHPERWAERTRSIYNWTEPHNSFHPASWERVANEEMWQARMKTAFFSFDSAERTQGEGKARSFESSYTSYTEIVGDHSEYPPNWDKNSASACERSLRSGHRGYSPDHSSTCSIQHFSLYSEKDPTDPQAEAIRSAVSHSLKERDRLRQSRKQTP